MPSASKENLVWGFLEAEIERRTAGMARASDDPDKELAAYMSEKRLAREDNPVEWWKNHREKYQRLSKIAFKYLVIPGTSMPSERVFSNAGSIVTKKRSRLSDENVRMLVCLNSTLK